MSVYEEVYDVVAQNMKNAELKFNYRKSTFLADVATNPQEIDVSKFLKLENEEFMEAIYIATIKRFPTNKNIVYLQQNYNLTKNQFQTEVLKSLSSSSLMAINHTRFINNPYFTNKYKLKYILFSKLYRVKENSSLRQFAKNLPKPIQNVIRKVFL